MLIRTIILVILVSLIPPANIYTQKMNSSADGSKNKVGDDIKFKLISIVDGLSQNTVYSICQDSKGFMWFGTQDGLNRYDGYGFKTYRNDPGNANSLSNNYIRVIYPDREGVLWLGTDGGLNKFDQTHDTFIRYVNENNNPNSLSSNLVYSIYEDRFGILWIGTDGGGLNKFDRENETFTHYQHDPKNPGSLSHNDVRAIYEDRSGLLWVGTYGGGLNKFDRERETFNHYKNQPGDPNSLSNNKIGVIYQDRSGVLWIGTDEGLNQFDREKDIFIRYSHDPKNPSSLSNNEVNRIFEDRSGIPWIGTSVGLNKFNRQEGTFTYYKKEPGKLNCLSDSFIYTICEDQSGILWFGTGIGGINIFDPGWHTFTHYKHDPYNPNSLGNDTIWSIYEDRSGLLWIGTWGGGINSFDRETGKFTRYQNQDNETNQSYNNIYTIYEDRSGVLWVGTAAGLSKFDRKKETFVYYAHDPDNPNSLSQNDAQVIHEDDAGILWVGTDGGLNKFDRQREIFTRYQHQPDNPNSLSHNNIRVIHVDVLGVMWIGTVNGLDKFDRKTGTFTHYKNEPGNPGSLSNNLIWVIYEDPADRGKILWIGTANGLNEFDRESETFTSFTTKNGLPNNAIYGVLQDGRGFLWISTNNGLSRFQRRGKIFKNYNVSDGLQGTEFNRSAYCKSRSGEMFFGGVNGFNAFFPDRIKDNPYIPPIALTSFKLFNKEVKFDTVISEINEITLNYDENVFSFEFAALSYRATAKNQYAYKMEGFDRDWIYSGSRREATYTNLDPGDYIFRVKGSNNDGLWNEKGISLRIRMLPPFWQTWWFRVTAILVILFCIFVFYRYKTGAVRRRAYQLEKLVKKRTFEQKQLQEKLLRQEKLAVLGQLAGGVGHELRNPLGVIKNAAYFLNMALENPGPQVKESLEIMEKEVENSERIIRSLLDFARANTPLRRKVDIQQILREALSGFKVPGNITVEYPVLKSLPRIMADPDQLDQVFKNIILNAVQAMPGGGQLSFEIDAKKPDWLIVSITDTGVGIPRENLEKIFEPLFTSKAKGIGLGMAITKTYIEGHGGSIEVQSQIGKGSTFTVKLPIGKK
jgi:two-component system sensor histidine kinase ChiS